MSGFLDSNHLKIIRKWEIYLLLSHVDKHGVDLIAVPRHDLAPLPPVLEHELGPALEQRPLQHHPHERHGAGVDQADPHTVGQQPRQDVVRTLDFGFAFILCYVTQRFTCVPA